LEIRKNPKFSKHYMTGSSVSTSFDEFENQLEGANLYRLDYWYSDVKGLHSTTSSDFIKYVNNNYGSDVWVEYKGTNKRSYYIFRLSHAIVCNLTV